MKAMYPLDKLLLLTPIFLILLLLHSITASAQAPFPIRSVAVTVVPAGNPGDSLSEVTAILTLGDTTDISSLHLSVGLMPTLTDIALYTFPFDAPSSAPAGTSYSREGHAITLTWEQPHHDEFFFEVKAEYLQVHPFTDTTLSPPTAGVFRQ